MLYFCNHKIKLKLSINYRLNILEYLNFKYDMSVILFHLYTHYQSVVEYVYVVGAVQGSLSTDMNPIKELQTSLLLEINNFNIIKIKTN